jgi:hypothetical protein
MKRVLFIIAFISLGLFVKAQETKGFKDNLFYGGNFGLGYSAFNGSSYFFGDISPIVGYKITDRIIVGPGLVYQYINQTFPSGARRYSLNFHQYGAKVFNRILFHPKVFSNIEAEWLSFQYFDGKLDGFGNPVLTRIPAFSFLVGGGYRQMINETSSMDLLVLFNLNDNIYSPYNNPIIRVGLGFNW